MQVPNYSTVLSFRWKHAFASLAMFDIQYLIKEWLDTDVCNFAPMYKTYIETKHENPDRLSPSEMGQADYLLTRPRKIWNSYFYMLFYSFNFLSNKM